MCANTAANQLISVFSAWAKAGVQNFIAASLRQILWLHNITRTSNGAFSFFMNFECQLYLLSTRAAPARTPMNKAHTKNQIRTNAKNRKGLKRNSLLVSFIRKFLSQSYLGVLFAPVSYSFQADLSNHNQENMKNNYKQY